MLRQIVSDEKFLPICVLPIRVRFSNEVIIEEDEAEVVAVAIHLPGVVGVFHERLQILLADRDRREHIARLAWRNQNLQKNLTCETIAELRLTKV